MESISDHRARHESRRQLALACAKALESMDCLQGTSPAYKLYLQVPMSFLGESEGWNEPGSVDLLICRAVDGLAALAIVFDTDDNSVHFPDRLPYMNIRRFALTGELDAARLEEAADAVRKAAAELPADAGKVRGTVKMAASPLRLVFVRGHVPVPTKDTLVRGQVLYPDGSVTPYGASCRLVLRRARGKDGWTDELDVRAPYYIKAKEALRFSRELQLPDRISLQDRLDSASDGTSADKAYPAHMAEILDRLLASPINNALWGFESDGQIEKLLPDIPVSFSTYGDALCVVRDLVRSYLENGQDRETYELAGDIMATLLSWLRKGSPYLPSDPVKSQPLRQWLNDCEGVPERALVSGVPLLCYLQGASARLGTGYPCGLYREDVSPARDTLQSVGKSLTSDWYRSTREFAGQDGVVRTFVDMYSLLVEPIFPDVDTCTLLHGLLRA